jgi:prolyl 4-hydroxylase
MIESESVKTEIDNEVVLFNDPKISTYDKLLSPEECEHLINLGKPFLEASVVSDSNGGHISSGRTSRTAWIDHFHDEITTKIANKISKLVEMPIENAEKFQLVHYGLTNEYKAHYDSWDHNGSEKTLRCIKYGGPRMITALIYLNNVEEGGPTRFTKLNINVDPEVGKLLVFENTIKDTIDKHPLSEHAGMPVNKGEKYICNLWFRQYSKSKLYSDLNPSYYKDIPKHSTRTIEDHSDSLQKLHDEKNIFKQDSLLTNDECESLINKCEFSDSKYPSAWLANNEYPSIIVKVASLCNVVPSYLENMNVIKYSSDQSHGPFLDAYDVLSERGKQYTDRLGQRVKTITICLSESMKYEFEKLNMAVICKKGTLVCYDNVRNTRQRDEQISHRVLNTSSNEGYLLNLYIREKDKNGYLNPSFKLVDPTPPTPKENITIETKEVVSDEDYIKTFSDVLNLFVNDDIGYNWRGLNSFNYSFRGDFNYFKSCILNFKSLRDEDKGLNYKNVLDVNYEFDEFNPVYVGNVVSDELLDLLKCYYRKTIGDKVFPLGDKQSNRFKAHNEPMARFLQYEILPLIEKITSKKLKPTYTYLSSYVKDSELPAHTDRADCEYTVSFLVNKDADWPIYLHKVKQPVKYKGRHGSNPDKDECLSLDSAIGGLIIFNGTDHLHFRENYSGDFYDILLLHYRINE